MKKNYLIFILLFLSLTGCRDYYIVDSEDVSFQDEYAYLIGAKYKLKDGCYLAISCVNKNFIGEERSGDNEFTQSYYKQTGLKPIENSDNKTDSVDIISDYFIVACGMNEAPLELDKKYVSKEIRGGTIVAVLPQGTEFTIKRIVKVYLDGNTVFVNTYVEFLSDGVIANAFLLVRNHPYKFYFKDNYVEMVTPGPENK